MLVILRTDEILGTHNKDWDPEEFKTNKTSREQEENSR